MNTFNIASSIVYFTILLSVTLAALPAQPLAAVELEVICGSMYSGKSDLLISRIQRAQIAKKKVQLFKHALDDRYHDVDKINAHNGNTSSENAILVRNANDILSHLHNDTDIIAIDEAQFLDPKVVQVCQHLLHPSKASHCRRLSKIIIAGLDLDFRGEPFGPMPQLLAIAHKVHKLHAICVVCGRDDFTVTQRIVNGQPANYHDEIIMVGAKETYEARCRQCHDVLHSPHEYYLHTEKIE
jgi:thymidine kinase